MFIHGNAPTTRACAFPSDSTNINVTPFRQELAAADAEPPATAARSAESFFRGLGSLHVPMVLLFCVNDGSIFGIIPVPTEPSTLHTPHLVSVHKAVGLQGMCPLSPNASTSKIQCSDCKPDRSVFSMLRCHGVNFRRRHLARQIPKYNVSLGAAQGFDSVSLQPTSGSCL